MLPYAISLCLGLLFTTSNAKAGAILLDLTVPLTFMNAAPGSAQLAMPSKLAPKRSQIWPLPGFVDKITALSPTLSDVLKQKPRSRTAKVHSDALVHPTFGPDFDLALDVKFPRMFVRETRRLAPKYLLLAGPRPDATPPNTVRQQSYNIRLGQRSTVAGILLGLGCLSISILRKPLQKRRRWKLTRFAHA